MILVASRPSALLRAGGRTIAGRLAEMLRRAGRPAEALVCPADMAADAADEIASWLEPCRVITDGDAGAAELAALLDDRGGPVLLADASIVYDPRLVAAAADWDEPCALVDSGGEHPGFAGIAALAPEAASSPAALLDLRGLAADLSPRDIDEMPRYSRAIRRALRPFWIPIDGRGDLPRARRTLARAAGKGHMEWYVVVLNRPVETFLSYFLAETPITPNQITFLSNVTAYAATALLALGRLWPALALVVVTGILDGLDGRQARIQIKTSKVGEWEHVFDALSEISWMLALGWHISNGFTEPLYLGGTLAWLAFYGLDNYSYTFFRIRRGMMIDEAGPIDAAIRFVGSRRNTSFAYFAVALALGYPARGFLVVVGLAGLTALAHWIRVATLLGRRHA